MFPSIFLSTSYWSPEICVASLLTDAADTQETARSLGTEDVKPFLGMNGWDLALNSQGFMKICECL
jgi:hypothetical protein